MSKVAILTDSNSGISQEQAKAYGVYVLPMPFYINDNLYYEGITLTQEQFYAHLEGDSDIHTSMPVVGDVLDRWDSLLKEYDEVVYIPMSSGLSSSCETAKTLAEDYNGRVEVQAGCLPAVRLQRRSRRTTMAELRWSITIGSPSQ